MHGKRAVLPRQMHCRHAVIHKVHITNCGEVIQWEQFPSALLQLKYQQAIKENINLLYNPKWEVKFCSHTPKQPTSQVSSYPLLLGHLSGLRDSHPELFCDVCLVLLFQTDKQEQNILLHHPNSCCSKHVVIDNHTMPRRLHSFGLLRCNWSIVLDTETSLLWFLELFHLLTRFHWNQTQISAPQGEGGDK